MFTACMGRSISHSAQCSILFWTPADIFLIIKRWNNSSPLLAFKSHYCQWGSVTGEGAGEVDGRLGMRKARLETKKSQWHEAVGGEQELIGPNHQWPESLSSGYAPPWSMALQDKCGKRHLPAAGAVETQCNARESWMTFWVSPWVMDSIKSRDLRLYF